MIKITVVFVMHKVIGRIFKGITAIGYHWVYCRVNLPVFLTARLRLINYAEPYRIA